MGMYMEEYLMSLFNEKNKKENSVLSMLLIEQQQESYSKGITLHVAFCVWLQMHMALRFIHALSSAGSSVLPVVE